MNSRLSIWQIMSWAFGVIVFLIGTINTFWGNDPGFGIFLIILSFIYFPPVTALFKKWTGISVHWAVKVFLGIFIIWAALGVGELFDKIDLMLMDF